MREIIFRAKRKDNGEWIYGNLFIPDYEDKPTEILIGTNVVRISYYVIPETVGQYTGLTDKNGTKIFEGDIFQMDDECTAVVVFDKGCFELQKWGICDADTENGYIEHGGGWGIVMHVPFGWYYIGNMEIIGNIFDNPELLKESE